MSVAELDEQQTAEPGAAEPTPGRGRRPIWLCADDYGISNSVNKAIRDLVMRGRINATSVMVVAPSFGRSEAASLNMLNAGVKRVAIGLHVTLTAPFRPASVGFRPTRAHAFLSLEQVFMRSFLRRLGGESLAAEVAAQLQAFITLFGRPPDFVDGHQHVQLFPRIREAFLGVVSRDAPGAWVRQCGRVPTLPRGDRKAMVLDRLSRTFQARAAAYGIRTNPAFAGTYDFAARRAADFAQLFPSFLERLPAESVVMCHPGFVDDELTKLDPLTALREREYEFLAGEGFPDVLAAYGVTLAAA